MGTSDDLLRMLNPVARAGVPDAVGRTQPVAGKLPFEQRGFDDLLQEFGQRLPQTDANQANTGGTPVANPPDEPKAKPALDLSRIENASLLRLIAQPSAANAERTAQ